MRTTAHRLLSLLALTAVGVVLPAGVAHAEPSASIVEGTNFTEARTITIRYSGFTAYERGFIQQCVAGDTPDFDFSASCPGSVTQVTPLLDKTEGTLSFRIFVGDEPSGTYPYSCGPTAVAGNEAHATCYIRLVQTSQEDYQHDLFLPITFEGAPAAGASATPAPSTATSAVATAGSAAPTTAVATSAASVAGAPKVTAVITRRAKTNVVRSFVLPIGVIVVGAGLGVLYSRRRQRRHLTIVNDDAPAPERPRIDV